MKSKLCLVMSLLLLKVNALEAIDFHMQSRIKGAVMGAALGDAFARVATNRSEMVDLTKPVDSFNEFREEDWVYDAGGYRIGIGTENTLILLNQLESLIEGRRFNYSKKKLMNLCTSSLTSTVKESLDNYFELRHYSPKVLRRISDLANHRIIPLSKPDVSALVRVIPVGLVFLDDTEKVQEIADLEIQLTDVHATTRIAGIALAVGIADAVRNIPVDETIEHMIQISEYYESKLDLNPFDSRPSKFMRLARQEATSGSKAKKLLGTKIGLAPIKGKWKGYDPAEVLGAVVYCFARHNGSLKGMLADCVSADGNNKLYATVGGALAGAKTGFWALKQEGYESDFEMIEKINVLQGICNDAYVVLSDFPYTGNVAGAVTPFRTKLMRDDSAQKLNVCY
jgi:ADP-ribosylglycohydrolase